MVTWRVSDRGGSRLYSTLYTALQGGPGTVPMGALGFINLNLGYSDEKQQARAEHQPDTRSTPPALH